MASRRTYSHRQVLSAPVDPTLYDARLKDPAIAAAVQTALHDEFGLDIGKTGVDRDFGPNSRRALGTLTQDERMSLIAAKEKELYPERFYQGVTDKADLADSTYVMRVQQKIHEQATARGQTADLGQDGPNGDGVTAKYNAKTDAALMAMSPQDRAALLAEARQDADRIDGKDVARAQASLEDAFGKLPNAAKQMDEAGAKQQLTAMAEEAKARAKAEAEQKAKAEAKAKADAEAKAKAAKTKTAKAKDPAIKGQADTTSRGIAPDAMSAQPASIDKLDPQSTAYFDMKTGRIHFSNGQSLPAGSGKGDAKNNYRVQNQRAHGPTPEGVWSVSGMAPNNYHMANGTVVTDDSFRLTPVGGTKTHGRDGFLVHPQHSQNYQTIGCIAVTDRATIHKINELKKAGLFKHLVVTRDYQQLKQQMAQKNGFGMFHSSALPPAHSAPGMG